MPSMDREQIVSAAYQSLEEFLDTLAVNERGVNVSKLARELNKDRNFMSGFLYACLALKLCDIEKIGNSISCYITEIGKKYKKKEKIVLFEKA